MTSPGRPLADRTRAAPGRALRRGPPPSPDERDRGALHRAAAWRDRRQVVGQLGRQRRRRSEEDGGDRAPNCAPAHPDSLLARRQGHALASRVRPSEWFVRGVPARTTRMTRNTRMCPGRPWWRCCPSRCVGRREAEVMFTLEDLDRAESIVRRHVPPTPQYAWPLLSEVVGTETWVKHENHTPVGAFKMRGGLVFVERLAGESGSVAGIVTATRGNHGQSIAFAGSAHGVPVTIVVPHGNSPEKNAAMVGFGATLIEHGHDFQAAREHAGALAEEHGLTMLGPFHRDLVTGVATYARELFGSAGELDAVYVPVGQGSGICG